MDVSMAKAFMRSRSSRSDGAFRSPSCPITACYAISGAPDQGYLAGKDRNQARKAPSTRPTASTCRQTQPHPGRLLLRNKDFALAHMVGRCHDALLLHLLDQPCRLVIADRQLALDIRGGTFAILDDDADRLIVKRILAIGIAAGVQPQHRVDAVGAILVGS